MTDIRSQLPECPLAYEVPFIPGNHIAFLIEIHATEIDWQMKMLPWTLASLINNTDIIMKGVHIYIVRGFGVLDRHIESALRHFDLPENTILGEDSDFNFMRSYNALFELDINYWAFRDANNTHKLPSEHILKAVTQGIEPYPDISEVPPAPQFYDMKSCTTAQFRHAIKHLLGAQLAMKI